MSDDLHRRIALLEAAVRAGQAYCAALSGHWEVNDGQLIGEGGITATEGDALDALFAAWVAATDAALVADDVPAHHP